jgi:hypothetical protein
VTICVNANKLHSSPNKSGALRGRSATLSGKIPPRG